MTIACRGSRQQHDDVCLTLEFLGAIGLPWCRGRLEPFAIGFPLHVFGPLLREIVYICACRQLTQEYVPDAQSLQPYGLQVLLLASHVNVASWIYINIYIYTYMCTVNWRYFLTCTYTVPNYYLFKITILYVLRILCWQPRRELPRHGLPAPTTLAAAEGSLCSRCRELDGTLVFDELMVG